MNPASAQVNRTTDPLTGFWRGIALTMVPLAAFLSFSVQPLVGKFLTPWHGGAASTWIGAMLFFQAALLGGYGWAMWLGGRRFRIQLWGSSGLAGAAAIGTLLPPPHLLGATGMSGVLLSLAAGLLPAMVFLFSTGLLLQAWMARAQGRIPYHLYSISNAGSLAALVLYPVAIEPYIGLRWQSIIWRSLLALLVVMFVATALRLRRSDDSAELRIAVEAPETVTPVRKLGWLVLSALTCICMLGATRHLAAEIGSNPLSWIVPLGLYLASFSLAFSGWRQAGLMRVCVPLLGIGLTGFMLLKGVTSVPLSGWASIWLVLVVGTGCFVGTGILYALRPQQRFLEFYVTLGVGGAIGGVFSSLSAPNLLTRDYEFIGASAALLVFAMGFLVRSLDGWRRGGVLVVIAAPIVGIVWVQQQSDRSTFQRVHHLRNIYGHIQIIRTPDKLKLLSETTGHGLQILSPESGKRRPTLYYVESSAVGTALQQLQKKTPTLNIGVVGLGAGTLATYARAGDTITFWDIDPNVAWAAKTAFSFLADTPASVNLIEEDGRKGLERSTGEFDIIVIDAFSGDSIPTHLLTAEAFQLYFARLQRHDGILLVHVSNRYIELFPVVAGNSRQLGWEALKVSTFFKGAGTERDLEPTSSQYVIVHRPHQRATVDSWFAAKETGGRVTRDLERMGEADPRHVLWTDDRNAIRDVLAFDRFLKALK